MQTSRIFIVCCALSSVTTARATDPVLTLTPNSTCYSISDTVTVNVVLSNGPAAIVGGEFFFSYDPASLTFNGAGPGPSVWTREIYEASGTGTIDYAVGIENTGIGATSGTMAVLTFTAAAEICNSAGLIAFRSHAPPTKITDTNDVDYLDPTNLSVQSLPAISIDNTAPTLICPSSLSVQCSTSLPAPYATLAEFTTASGSASDACSGIDASSFELVSTSSLSGTNCSGTITRTYRIRDNCGNPATCDQTINIADTTPPTFTCPPSLSAQCSTALPAPYSTLANLISAGGSASDTCSGVDASSFELLTTSSLSGTNCSGTIMRTYRVRDNCGNSATCDQTINIADTIGPVVTPPSNMSVNADAGGCTASVSLSGSAIDNCDGSVPVTFWIGASQIASPHVFPQGTTTVTVKASDSCGNPGSATFDVTVTAFNQMQVAVQLSPNISPTGTLSRCITFELWRCAPLAGPVVINQVLDFAVTAGVPNTAIANAIIQVPCGDYSCITARDKLHTLRRTVSLGISGTQYTADFTGNTHWLISGNLNDDAFIDITDFAIFVNRFNTNYGTGNTSCITPPPYHADISGDGIVNAADFTFVQINFLSARDANCCGQPAAADSGPVTDISVAELRAMGMGNLAVADLNRDGRVNQTDIALFMLGVRPNRSATGSPD